jgi:hypothetical protein
MLSKSLPDNRHCGSFDLKANVRQSSGMFGNAFQPLVVQVTNVNGVPLPGQTVEFAGVAFSENFVITDAKGMASDQPLLLGVGISFARAFTDHTPNRPIRLTLISP